VRPWIRPQGVLWTLVLCGLSIVSPLNAQMSDGPLGLPWGMPKEAVERLGIRLCCRQVGTWGTRYTVDRQDFTKLPRSFGDEEKIYWLLSRDRKSSEQCVFHPKVSRDEGIVNPLGRRAFHEVRCESRGGDLGGCSIHG
jgi:hypothetical protein